MWNVSECRKRWLRMLCVLVSGTLFFLYNWVYEASEEAHNMPSVKQVNIYEMVKRRSVPKPVLHLLATQTGVNESGVAGLLEKGAWWQLLELQAGYFAPVSVESVPSTPLTITEYLLEEQGADIKGIWLQDVRDGDILVTKNSRFLGWRNGHAGLVIDADAGLVLEAIMLGTNTKFCSLKKWEQYPAVMVLRLKEEVNQNGQSQRAVEYARQYLLDVPYRLLAGVGDRLFPTKVFTVHAAENACVIPISDAGTAIKGTQCAHLVWYAYKQAGIDLDSDGGVVVTPHDIQESWYLDIVQAYGY